MLEIVIKLEMWKDIPGFNDWYQVSNCGRVRSKDKRIPGRYGPEHRLSKSKILNVRTNNKGYEIVDLYDNGKKKTCLVHRLVALMFVENPNLTKYSIVNHKDNNHRNNNYWNLEWTDNSGNMKHAQSFKIKQPHVTKVPVTLTDVKTGKILYEFNTIMAAAKFIKRDPSIVRRLINSDTNNIRYGYKWEKSSTTIENDSDQYYVITIE